jgi:serine transporter
MAFNIKTMTMQSDGAINMNQYQETMPIKERPIDQHWSQQDTSWMLSLFGTAVGAGILFLPVQLGVGGFWPLIFLAICAYPTAFFAHRALARFVLSSKQQDADFTDVVEEHFGANAGRLISILYFMSIIPILLIYGVGITNTVDSFIVHQLGLASPPRALLSFGLIFGFMSIIICGEQIILKAFAAMVYPLTVILGFLSLYLIPSWQIPDLSYPEFGSFMNSVWLAVPVILFAFSHTAVISTFVQAQRRHYGNQASDKSEQILRKTNVMLVGFVLMFVFSCVLTLSPEQLMQAQKENVSVLSFLANVTDNKFIEAVGPFIAFIAITSSFLGHFMGARESFNGLATKFVPKLADKIDRIGVALMFFAIWGTAIMNPSIISIMGKVSGPIIAMILCIMPAYSFYKVKSLQQYRNEPSTYYIVVVGTLAVIALITSYI